MTAWYNTLLSYFPVQEMKSKAHMDCIFADKSSQYRNVSDSDSVLIFFEQDRYIFVDFMLVTASRRGSGIGAGLLDTLKRKGKPIILEVEPETSEDPDTIKRVRFYKKQGFQVAPSIRYKRIHAVTGLPNVMDVFYWSPRPVREEDIFAYMSDAYKEVHAYRAQDFYGKPPQSVNEVLSWRDVGKAKEAAFSRKAVPGILI